MVRRFLVLTLAFVWASLGAAAFARADASVAAIERAEERLAARFAASGVVYPPRAVTLVALKAEARLELWADDGGGARFVRSYLVRATSGQLGPKLREGDHQVPEGVYRVAALNPNSRYHLSLRLDYPNAADQAHGRADGRSTLGGDIMIHGDNVSDGCLPLGDAGVEEVFALAQRVGPESIAVIVSPQDLRRVDVKTALARAAQHPAWLGELYASLQEALRAFPLPASDDAAPPSHRLRAGEAKCAPYDLADCAKRCDAGDAASCSRAGVLLADGRGVAANPDRAWPLLLKACAAGDALGCSALGALFVADDGPRRDASRAADLEQAACDAGEGHGCAALAKLCTDGLLYPKAREGCAPAQVDRLRVRAVAALRTDCRGWGAYDCHALASIYATGDAPTAHQFASGACSGGDPGGCDELARLYDDEGDRARARALFGRSCGSGYAPACARLAAGDDLAPAAGTALARLGAPAASR